MMAVMEEQERFTIMQRLEELRVEHRDLDDIILRLSLINGLSFMPQYRVSTCFPDG